LMWGELSAGPVVVPVRFHRTTQGVRLPYAFTVSPCGRS
jgi:hypothetical protein